MSFQKYPLSMKHPQHRPAVISKDEWRNGKVIKAAPGSPERFPDVFVNNEDQEKDYASKGYVPSGTSDPEAYRRAMAGADLPASHEHQDYPRWMYQANEDGDIEVITDDGVVMVKGVLVNDESAQKRLKGDWFEMPSQAAEFSLLQDEETDASPASTEPAQARGRGARKVPEAA